MPQRTKWPVIIIGALWCLAGALAAQPADTDEPPDMPRAGVPPVDDGLPRLSDEHRSRAAVQMLLVVSVAFVLVVILLRWFAKANREAVRRATQQQDMVDRTMEALERFEAGDEHRTDDTPPH